MADNVVKLILQAQDNISKVLKQVEGGVDGLNKKVEQQKSFLDTFKQNWLGVTAAVAAAAVILNKAWDFAEQAAQFKQSYQAFESMATSMGKVADTEFKKIKAASAGLIDDKSLVEAANKALSLGIPIEKLGDLMLIARAKARDMGITTTQAFSDIATGIGRGSPMIIDNLGITLKLGEANEAYAKTLGKTADQLTTQEKKIAILNAVLDSGSEALGRHDLATKTTKEKMESLTATFNDLKVVIGEGLIRAAFFLTGTFQSVAAAALAISGGIFKLIEGAATLTDWLGITENAAAKWKFQAEAAFAAADELAKKAGESFKDMASGADNAAKATGNITKGIQEQKATYEDYIKGLQAGSEEYKKIQEAEQKVLAANIAYEKALLDKALAEKKISQEKYVEDILKLSEKTYQAELANLNRLIDAAKAEGEAGFEKRAQLEAQKTALIKNHATERIKIETDAIKEAEKTEKEAFDNWKALQELRLQSLQAQMSLEEALDKAAVDAGVLRESEAMENRLARLKEFHKEKIDALTEQLAKEAELHSSESPEYQKIYTERENLQKSLQAKIIESEQQISDTRIKEETEALAVLAELTGDREALIEQEYANNLKVIEDYYAQGIYDAKQYHDALTALEEKRTEDLRKNEEAQRAIRQSTVIATQSQMDVLRAALSSALNIDLTPAFFKIEYFSRWYGGAMMPNLVTVTADAMNEIQSLIGKTPAALADAFNNMGRYVSSQMFVYAQQIADYLNWVKEKVQGLQSLIQSYREQLMQMQGDEVGLVELWHEKELARLKEEFAGLENSQEYKDALKLLEELYKKKLEAAEKAMKAEDDMWKAHEEKKKSGVGAGAAPWGSQPAVSGEEPAGAAGELPGFSRLRQRLEDALTPAKEFFGMEFFTKPMQMELKKEIRLDSFFELKSLDPEAVRKTCYETIFPEWEKYLRLKGVEL